MILEKRVDRAVRYWKIADNMLHGDKAQSVPVFDAVTALINRYENVHAAKSVAEEE